MRWKPLMARPAGVEPAASASEGQSRQLALIVFIFIFKALYSF